MNKSESIREISKALVAFQSEVETIKKSAKNPFFKSKYASLADILNVIREPLAKNGLAFAQFPTGNSELETIIMHESGEFISSSCQMQPAKNDPQAIGSAITYMRRYALGAILGLNIEGDDDGNAASGKTTDTPAYKPSFMQ